MRPYHEPVMTGEVVRFLNPRPGGVVIDGTVGGGGHALLIGQKLGPNGTLVCLDQDPDALETAREALKILECRVILLQGNFRNLPALLDSQSIGMADGLLLDLGVSSHQLDVAERGFSFRQDGPLDERMDPTRGITAAELIRRSDRKELARIIREYGEERWSDRISAFIKDSKDPVETTGQLADIVKAAIPRKAWPRDIHPASRTFMALRIAVNEELDALNEVLEGMVPRMAADANIVILSYHSLEDRIVKRAFLKFSGRCQCPPGLPECRCGARKELEILTRKPLEPMPEETFINPRARSARLRAARKVMQ